MFKITVKGDKAVLNNLKRKGQGFNNVMKAAVRTAGLQVENAAKVNCPAKTGNLRRSIMSTDYQIGNKYIARITPDKDVADYAVYVEVGHSQQPGRYVPAIGKRLVASWVEGRWYMARTGIQMKSRIENNLKTAFRRAMVEIYV